MEQKYLITSTKNFNKGRLPQEYKRPLWFLITLIDRTKSGVTICNYHLKDTYLIIVDNEYKNGGI